MEINEIKEEKDMVEEKEKKPVKSNRKGYANKKWLYFLLGIFLFLFLVVGIASLAGYFTLQNSTKIREFFSNCVKIKEDNNEEESESLNIVVTEEESSTIALVEKSTPSVVSIAVSQIALSQGQGVVDESSNIGTGFLVDSSGIVITNQHVVSDITEDYEVVTVDGEEYNVTEILRDDLYDIALLKIDAEGKTFDSIDLGDSDSLLVGQSVIAIGTPLGEYAGTVTSGIISGLNRTVTAASSSWFGSTSKTYEGVIQTDAAINAGNSGGPLINSQGEVIGINFATTSGADNISFSLPINKVKSRLEEYRTYGKFIKPYMGVSYKMISEYYALYYTNVVPGALIVEIDSNGPAYVAGIRKGDIVTTFGGEEVSSSLSDMIQGHKVGDEVEVIVNRAGETKTFKVTLVETE